MGIPQNRITEEETIEHKEFDMLEESEVKIIKKMLKDFKEFCKRFANGRYME